MLLRIILGVLFLLFVSSDVSSASETEVAVEPEWAGVWLESSSSSGANREYLWFEPGRCGWLRAGKAEFYRADYSATGAVLERWARRTELELRLEEGQLLVTAEGRDRAFQRAPSVPVELRVEPYPLPEDFEIDEATVEMLKRDLVERRDADQRVRTQTRDMAEMQRVDGENTEFLRAVVQELGWIDVERFGAQASNAAFLIVQHSPDVRLMATALPKIEFDVKGGRLDGQAFALLWDRYELNLGRLQRYGTQIGGLEDGTQVLMPCEDLERVDEHRKALGMRPLEEYLAFFATEEQGPPKPLEPLRAD